MWQSRKRLQTRLIKEKGGRAETEDKNTNEINETDGDQTKWKEKEIEAPK